MTLGDFRKQTEGLPDSIELNTVVNLSNEASEYEDILDCTVELHRLDVAKEDGSIDLFVSKDRGGKLADFEKIVRFLQSQMDGNGNTVFETNTIILDGIADRLIAICDENHKNVMDFKVRCEFCDESHEYYSSYYLSDWEIATLAAELTIAKPVSRQKSLNEEIEYSHNVFTEIYGHHPKYAFVGVQFDNDDTIFHAMIKLRDYDKENTELDPDYAYIEFYADGLPELLQINSERTADFVITEFHYFSDNLSEIL